MIYSFKNNEAGYEEWLRNNDQGFVFNYCHTPSLNKLHQAKCAFINRPKDSGVRTNLEKICSTSYSELEHKVDGLCGGGWSKCGHCFR